MDTNRQRAARIARELATGNALGVNGPSDRAAEIRMNKIIADPSAGLNAVRDHADDSIRRLYRQRNAVLHNGKTDAVALPSTLRVVSPLVGAGLDRIAHGWFVREIEPLRLGAVAELAYRGSERRMRLTSWTCSNSPATRRPVLAPSARAGLEGVPPR